MSETNVNKDGDDSDQKKVKFSESDQQTEEQQQQQQQQQNQKQQQHKNKDHDDDIDEEGRKSRVSRASSSRSRASSSGISKEENARIESSTQGTTETSESHPQKTDDDKTITNVPNENADRKQTTFQHTDNGLESNTSPSSPIKDASSEENDNLQSDVATEGQNKVSETAKSKTDNDSVKKVTITERETPLVSTGTEKTDQEQPTTAEKDDPIQADSLKEETKSVSSTVSKPLLVNEEIPKSTPDEAKSPENKGEPNHSDEDKEEIQQNQSGYSLNSRSNNRLNDSRNSMNGSEKQEDDNFPHYMTDDDKISEQNNDDNKQSDNRSYKSERSENSHPFEETRKTPTPNEASIKSDKEEKEPLTSESSMKQDSTENESPKPIEVKVVEKEKPEPPQKTPTQQQRPVQAKHTSQTKSKAPPKVPERSSSPRQIVARDKHDNRRQAQSARYPQKRSKSSMGDDSARTSTSRASSRWSRPPSRPRTCGYLSEERRRKEKEFFYAELNRLKDSLKKESKKIKKPKVRDHYPDVFTSLEPYYNTYTANYLINMPDMGYKEKQPEEATKKKATEDEDENTQELKYMTRNTAIGLTDPWDSLNMDRSVLPKIETAEMRKKRMDQMHQEPKQKSGSPRPGTSSSTQASKKRPEAKQGSTRLPKFPVIQPPNSDLTTKELSYGDVPMLRNEMTKSFSHSGDAKKKSDYTRTKQDFYRMELDRMNEYHVISRPHMRAAYFAYLQNTPGSRQALYDCIKEMGKKESKPNTPQAVA